MRVEIGLRLPRGAVDALQHAVRLVAAPVGAGHRGQLHGVDLELRRAGHVGAPAQVRERGLRVGGDLLALGKLVDELELVGLTLEGRAGLFACHDPAHEGVAARHDRAHARLDLGEVLGRERAGQLEVVVEPVLDGRPDGHLGVGKELQHRLGHHVGEGVADCEEPVLCRRHGTLHHEKRASSDLPSADRVCRAPRAGRCKDERPVEALRGSTLLRAHDRCPRALSGRPVTGAPGGAYSAPAPCGTGRFGPLLGRGFRRLGDGRLPASGRSARCAARPPGALSRDSVRPPTRLRRRDRR